MCMIYKKLISSEIGERYRLNYAMIVKLYHPCTQFPLTFVYVVGD